MEKGSLYARAGIRDSWILNLLDNVLVVYREAEPDPDRPCGWRYRSAITFRAGDLVTPLATPSTRISVDQLGQRRARAASPAPDGIGDLRPVLVAS